MTYRLTANSLFPGASQKMLLTSAAHRSLYLQRLLVSTFSSPRFLTEHRGCLNYSTCSRVYGRKGSDGEVVWTWREEVRTALLH